MKTELIRVVLFEDNPADARLIREALSEYQGPTRLVLEHFDRLAPGLKRLPEPGVDAVLLDLSLPDARGLETLQAVQECRADLPIVVLTGMNDETLALEAVRQGAQDYLVKGRADGELLVRAIHYALERQSMQSKLRRLTLMEERERIARDLHDDVIQTLYGVGLLLVDMTKSVDDQDLTTRLGTAAEQLGRTANDVRAYIHELQVDHKDEPDLSAALEHLARDFQTWSGVPTKLEIDRQVARRLTASKPQLVQIAREALSNVAKHASASSCRICIDLRDDENIVLEIEDDGAGFKVADVNGSGFGLHNLRERAVSLGGTMEIDSAPSAGTTVRVILPPD